MSRALSRYGVLVAALVSTSCGAAPTDGAARIRTGECDVSRARALRERGEQALRARAWGRAASAFAAARDVCSDGDRSAARSEIGALAELGRETEISVVEQWVNGASDAPDAELRAVADAARARARVVDDWPIRGGDRTLRNKLVHDARDLEARGDNAAALDAYVAAATAARPSGLLWLEASRLADRLGNSDRARSLAERAIFDLERETGARLEPGVSSGPSRELPATTWLDDSRLAISRGSSVEIVDATTGEAIVGLDVLSNSARHLCKAETSFWAFSADATTGFAVADLAPAPSQPISEYAGLAPLGSDSLVCEGARWVRAGWGAFEVFAPDSEEFAWGTRSPEPLLQASPLEPVLTASSVDVRALAFAKEKELVLRRLPELGSKAPDERTELSLPAPAKALTVRSDGLAVVLLADGAIVAYRAPSTDPLWSVRLEWSSPFGLSSSRDGAELYVLDGVGVIVLSASTGAEVRKITPQDLGFPVASVAASPNGRQLAILGGQRVAFESVSGGAPLAIYRQGRFQPDSAECAARTCTLRAGLVLRTLELESGQTRPKSLAREHILVSPNGDRALRIAQTIIIESIEDPKSPVALRAPKEGSVFDYQFVWSSDGARLGGVSGSGVLAQWNALTGELLGERKLESSAWYSPVAVTSNGRMIVRAGRQVWIATLDGASKLLSSTWDSLAQPVVSADGRVVVVPEDPKDSSTGELALFDLETGLARGRIGPVSGAREAWRPFSAVVIDARGERIAWRRGRSIVLATEDRLAELHLDARPISFLGDDKLVAIDGEGRLLVLALPEGAVLLERTFFEQGDLVRRPGTRTTQVFGELAPSELTCRIGRYELPYRVCREGLVDDPSLWGGALSAP
ncbi:MAG: hypothetical protein U0271_46910 [Polyangiaceae bacterium]